MKKKLVTERFTNRVENYVKYRPDYPETAIAAIIRICKLTNNSVVADIGAGTGKFTRSLLQHEMQVFAVEPNQAMRQSAEELLTKFTGFHSQPGTAEHTGLAGCSVDLVVAAQAFHWFSSVRTLEEFSRILKPDGWLGLIWNRRTMTEPFHREYDAILRKYAPEYNLVNHMNIEDNDVARLFDPESYHDLSFDHFQALDQQGFLGRMQSSSYIPTPESPQFIDLLAAAKHLFARYQERGRITFRYDTRLYLGQLLR